MEPAVPVDQAHWKEFWEAVCRQLNQVAAPNLVRAWVEPLRFGSAEIEAGTLKLHVYSDSDWGANWAKDHFKRALETIVGQLTGVPCDLYASVEPGLGTPATLGERTLSSSPETVEPPSAIPSVDLGHPRVLVTGTE